MAISCHCVHRTASRLFAAMAVVSALSACHRGVPPIDTSPKPAEARDATISGSVRAPGGAMLVERRAIEVVNIATGERQRTTTNSDGAFAFRLRPGQYRVELALRDGEQVIRQPGVIRVAPANGDDRADFILGASSPARPRHRAPRPDDGLGSAIG